MAGRCVGSAGAADAEGVGAGAAADAAAPETAAVAAGPATGAITAAPRWARRTFLAGCFDGAFTILS